MELYTKLKMSENVIYLVENKFKRFFHAEYNNIKLNNEIIDIIPKYKKDIILLVIASRSDFYDKLILNHWVRYIKYVEDKYENVKIYLIFGKDTNIDIFNDIRENILLLDTEDSLIPGIYNKTIKAFEKINLSYDYKYIFRTNLSSFIRIDFMIEKIKGGAKTPYGVVGNYNGVRFCIRCRNVIK